MSEVPRGITQEEINKYEGVKFASQKEGLDGLYCFLIGETTFSQVSPFTLDLAGRAHGRGTTRFQFYLGRDYGVNIYLRLGIDSQYIESGLSSLYVVPNQSTRGINPYFWLNFYVYGPRDSGLEKFPASACRLMPGESSSRIDFQEWHNLGEQLIADYLVGANGITFDDLLPFVLYVKQKISLANYRLGADSRFIISIYENRLVEDEDIFRFIPKKGEIPGYEWVDILKESQDLSKERWPLVTSYRMFPQEHRFSTKNWFGYERQLLLDHLSGNHDIVFEDLRPIRAITKNDEAINLGVLNGKQLSFYFPFGEVVSQTEVVLVPRHDTRRRYRWLELYKVDPLTGEPQGEYISSGRVIEGRIENKSWQGPEMQLLKDYAHGEVGFDELVPVPLVRATTDLLSLWREKYKKTYIVLSQKFGLQEGDHLSLVPDGSTKEYADFLLAKDEVLLGRYRFDLKHRLFKLEEIFFQRDGLTYDKDTGIYKDKKNEAWVSLYYIHSKYGNSAEVADSLDSIRKIEYRTKSASMLYNLADVGRVMTEVLLPTVDPETGIFEDEERQWISLPALTDETGLIPEVITNRLEGIPSMAGRSNGRRTTLYSAEEAKRILQDFLSLLKVDPETGRYTDQAGEWAMAQDLAKEYQVAIGTVTAHVEGVSSIRARGRIDREVTLYNRAQFERMLYGEALDKKTINLISSAKSRGTESVSASHQSIFCEQMMNYFSGGLPFDQISPAVLSRFYGSGRYRTVYLGQTSELGIKVMNLTKEIVDIDEVQGEFLAVPREDTKGGYKWLEIYQILEGNAVNMDNLISSFRVNQEEGRLETRRWYGPERQRFLDYLDGKDAIIPADLQEFSAKVVSPGLIRLGWVGNKLVTIRDSAFRVGEQLVFKPGYDEEEGLTWVDIYSQDEDGNQKLLTSRRLHKGNLGLSDLNIVEIVKHRIRERPTVLQPDISQWLKDEDYQAIRETLLFEGKIRWSLLKDQPEVLQAFIEREAQEFIATGGELTQTSLGAAYRRDLIHAAQHYYPGGLVGLREYMGQVIHPRWTIGKGLTVNEEGLPVDERGRIFWSRLAEDSERIKAVIEQQIMRFVQAGNHYSQKNLKKAGLSGLGMAITQYYPGGSEGIRLKLGLSLLREQRPQGYWKPERVREAALPYFLQYGNVTPYILMKEKRHDLENVVRKYPGGIEQLVQDLKSMAEHLNTTPTDLERLLEL
ncbi:hypothetical protein HYS91_01030 [Candidatus Daviesbacteria bacterium]|nr:hypothetical protein [Candidatus Daviesbacteria bacterium]